MLGQLRRRWRHAPRCGRASCFRLLPAAAAGALLPPSLSRTAAKRPCCGKWWSRSGGASGSSSSTSARVWRLPGTGGGGGGGGLRRGGCCGSASTVLLLAPKQSALRRPQALSLQVGAAARRRSRAAEAPVREQSTSCSAPQTRSYNVASAWFGRWLAATLAASHAPRTLEAALMSSKNCTQEHRNAK